MLGDFIKKKKRQAKGSGLSPKKSRTLGLQQVAAGRGGRAAPQFAFGDSGGWGKGFPMAPCLQQWAHVWETKTSSVLSALNSEHLGDITA